MSTEACEACASHDEDKVVVTDTTNITSILANYITAGELKSLESVDVVPFLTKRLKWRVVTVS